MPSDLAFCIYSLIATLIIPCLGTWLMRRSTNSLLLENHKEVFGYVYAVVGLLYSIVLGYSVVGMSQSYNRSEINTHLEATSLLSIDTLSKGLPAENQTAIHAAVLNYCDDVLNREWPEMAANQMPPVSTPALKKIEHDVLNVKATTLSETAIYTQLLSSMDDLAKRRAERLSASDHLPLIMWIGLILGGMITVGFSFMFVTKHALLQLMITGALTFIIFINIDVIYALQYAHEGMVHVSAESFREIREVLQVQ